MIPKIIHYCWFGMGEKPKLLRACIRSWDKLKAKGYTIIEWNEQNCDITENAFVAKMYAEKKWAFVSDYFRLKALVEWGGVYLDTDVLVYRPFDKLLSSDLFLGYIFDCSLGTAVIGASKGNRTLRSFMAAYQDDTSAAHGIVNNLLLTEYFYHNVPGFRLNGKRQSLMTDASEKIEIFPKETFETGRVIGKTYALHFMDGSWWKKPKKYIGAKLFLTKLPLNVFAWHKRKFANEVMKKEGELQNLYYAVNSKT